MARIKRTPEACKVWWCNRSYYAMGYCLQHYRIRQRENGDPIGPNAKHLHQEASDLRTMLTLVMNVAGTEVDHRAHNLYQTVSKKLKEYDDQERGHVEE
jgi:hypothetical protein